MRRKLPLLLAVAAAGALAGLDTRTFDAAKDAVTRAAAQLSGDATSLVVVARAETSGLVFDDLQPPAAAPEWAELPPPVEEDEPEVEPEVVEEPQEVAEAPVLVSLARETWVWSKPHGQSRRLGYLRAGAIVERDSEPVRKKGCRGGWYAIQPQGFVCVGRNATIDRDHPIAKLSARRPDLTGLPYTYVQSRYPTPPFYARLPTEEQQKRYEPSLERYRRKHERLSRDPAFVPFPAADPIPALLAENALVPGLEGSYRGPDSVRLGRARVRSGFALLGTYNLDGRRFGLTTEMAVLPLDRTRMVAESTMKGVILSDEFTLPIAIVTSRHARRWAPHPESGALGIAGLLTRRSAVGITGKVIRRGGQSYLEAKDGSFLRQDQVVRVNRFRKAPAWAKRGKKWVDVSILKQALVAYEGERPVYVTLVSTGADGLEDPSESHATVRGTFLIHTKHVSVTMDGDEAGDEFDLRDVPYVQYFTEGYALHGAYWHDDFGKPRSHGCVNLAPVDAAWLFGWTDPQVPDEWHAALSLKRGTTVYIHP